MNEDYLWDKSGEPDPQIQELEEILAPLRYQPKPLEIPVTPKRNYFPLLAIAATVLIALLAGGLWLRLRTEKADIPQQQAQAEPSVPSVYKEEVVKNTAPPKKPMVVRKRRNNGRQLQREEALAAKEQLMVALRLASEKLKSAQRRTQGPSPNQIKNQHKVG